MSLNCGLDLIGEVLYGNGKPVGLSRCATKGGVFIGGIWSNVDPVKSQLGERSLSHIICRKSILVSRPPFCPATIRSYRNR